MQTSWVEQLNITQEIKYTIQAEPITIFADPPPAEDHLTFGQLIFFLYLAGIIILSIHLVDQGYWQ